MAILGFPLKTEQTIQSILGQSNYFLKNCGLHRQIDRVRIKKLFKIMIDF